MSERNDEMNKKLKFELSKKCDIIEISKLLAKLCHMLLLKYSLGM